MKSALLAPVLASLAGVATIVGCPQERTHLDETTSPALEPPRRPVTSGIVAGPATQPTAVENPFEGNAHAIQEGHRLYRWFNCDACHGAIGGGSMGPPLRDSEWIYGGEPENIHQSILQGRPEGMPAFGSLLANDAAWQLVAFVRSLGEGPLEEPGSVATKPEKALRLPEPSKASEQGGSR